MTVHDAPITPAAASPATSLLRRRAAQAAAAFRIEAGQQLRGLGALGLAILALLPSLPWAIAWASLIRWRIPLE